MAPESFFTSFLNHVSPTSNSLVVWFFQAIAIWITDLCLKQIKITSPIGPILMVIALSFINSRIWDTALFFQIPNSLTSQTITIFLVNGVIFWVLIKILPGIEIQGFSAAFIAPIIFTISNIAITYVVEHTDTKQVYEYITGTVSDLKDFVSESKSADLTKNPSQK